MYVRGHAFRPKSTRYEDWALAAVAGSLLAIFAGLVLGFYFLMQPTTMPNRGLAAYQPPPKAVVHYAKTPWVPPVLPSEAPLPSIAAFEPEPASSVVEEPKPEVRKQEARTIPRRARPVREQPNPFIGFFSSPRPAGRGWF